MVADIDFAEKKMEGKARPSLGPSSREREKKSWEIKPYVVKWEWENSCWVAKPRCLPPWRPYHYEILDGNSFAPVPVRDWKFIDGSLVEIHERT